MMAAPMAKGRNGDEEEDELGLDATADFPPAAAPRAINFWNEAMRSCAVEEEGEGSFGAGSPNISTWFPRPSWAVRRELAFGV